MKFSEFSERFENFQNFDGVRWAVEGVSGWALNLSSGGQNSWRTV
jgi:hypothetical protein